MGRHCAFGTCNSDSRYSDRPHMQGVFFIPFPKPHLNFEKCKRWVDACAVVGFTTERVKKDTYVCSKHFVGGKGPTEAHPDLISAYDYYRLIQQPVEQIISIDSDSNDSNGKEPTKCGSSTSNLKDYGVTNFTNVNTKEGVNTAQESSLPNEQSTVEDLAASELRKLSFDQNGTFMADFDPEKSNRELRKMNRRMFTKNSRKKQYYDETGKLIENSMDLCDCLDKECPGCHFPCSKCNSCKCGRDCRCNRKYITELIEVEGTETTYNFPE